MTTIVIPISRIDHLDLIFAQIELMTLPEDTALFTYVEGDMNLLDKARVLTLNSKFRNRQCVYRGRQTGQDAGIYRRRIRIAEIHNELRQLIPHSDFVLLLEDDGIFPVNTFEKLRQHYSIYPYAGFISGVELGRWGIKTPGVWKVDDIYDIKRIESVMPGDKLQSVDAAGLYCMLTRYENYKKFEFAEFDTILGPDFSYGIHLRKQGLENYVDWSIKLDHLTKKEPIRFKDGGIQKSIITPREGDGKWQLDIVG